MNDYTKQFLRKCKEKGISLVSIVEITKLIPSSIRYMMSGGCITFDSVYSECRDKDGHLLIWDAAQEFGIFYGCGNTGQCQITSEASAKLDHGVYQLNDGEWEHVSK